MLFLEAKLVVWNLSGGTDNSACRSCSLVFAERDL